MEKPTYKMRVHPLWANKDPQLQVFLPEGSSEKEWTEAMGRALKNYPEMVCLLGRNDKL